VLASPSVAAAGDAAGDGPSGSGASMIVSSGAAPDPSAPLFMVGTSAAVAASGAVGASGVVDAADTDPSAVTVNVLDHATAQGLNVPGFLFRVQRSDGVSAPGSVRAVINYASFADAYNADYPYRLQVVSYPECLLTTPDVAGCGIGTPLTVTNDVSAQTLTVDVTAAADPSASASLSGSAAVSSGGASPRRVAPKCSVIERGQ
jgi:hypothetical protein